MRGRRVGTLTLGVTMVAAGLAFLVWVFAPKLVDIWFCLKFWPVVLILLGLEVLASWAFAGEDKLRYDGAGLVLLAILLMGCFMVAALWSAANIWGPGEGWIHL